MIEVSRLTKDFARNRVLDDVSFRVGRGEIAGFLGPNGAGKTTTIRILTGFLPATRGVATVAGHDVFRQSEEVRRRVGYLPENVPLYTDLRVEEYLLFRARLKGIPRRERRRRVDASIERAAVGEVRRKLVGALSRGFRQRVGLADALLADPPVLILDEPTSGLDPLQRIEVKRLIAGERGARTILFSSHILPEVESVCERVVIIHRGRIVADGDPAELVRKLGGANRFRVEIACGDGGPGTEAVREALRAIPGVRGVAPGEARRGEGGGPYEVFVLTGEESADPRSEVFSLVAARKWKLRELTRESSSLEEIFARIALELGGETAPAASAPPAEPAPAGGVA